MAITKLENLFNPQVLADMVSAKLPAAIKFAPLATVNRQLEGRPGNTITMPKYEYIGDAVDVPEGTAIPIEMLAHTDTQVTIKKAGKGVELTDESLLAGYGDPIEEAEKQLVMAIANKIDNDIVDELNAIRPEMTVDASTDILNVDAIADALVKFGEDIEGPMVLFIAASQLAQLRKSEEFIRATDLGDKMLYAGSVGSILGCQIVVSNKIKAVDGKINNFIIKPGAFSIYMKRDVKVESDRDIVKKTTVITADEHYVAYLSDESKAIKLITAEKQA